MVALGGNAEGRTHGNSFYISRLGNCCEGSFAAGLKVFIDEIGRTVVLLGCRSSLQLCLSILLAIFILLCTEGVLHYADMIYRLYDTISETTSPSIDSSTIQKTENGMFVSLCIGQKQ